MLTALIGAGGGGGGGAEEEEELVVVVVRGGHPSSPATHKRANHKQRKT